MRGPSLLSIEISEPNIREHGLSLDVEFEYKGDLEEHAVSTHDTQETDVEEALFRFTCRQDGRLATVLYRPEQALRPQLGAPTSALSTKRGRQQATYFLSRQT